MHTCTHLSRHRCGGSGAGQALGRRGGGRCLSGCCRLGGPSKWRGRRCRRRAWCSVASPGASSIPVPDPASPTRCCCPPLPSAPPFPLRSLIYRPCSFTKPRLTSHDVDDLILLVIATTSSAVWTSRHPVIVFLQTRAPTVTQEPTRVGRLDYWLTVSFPDSACTYFTRSNFIAMRSADRYTSLMSTLKPGHFTESWIRTPCAISNSISGRLQKWTGSHGSNIITPATR